MRDGDLTPYVPRMLLRHDRTGPGHWVAEGTLVFADVSGFTRLTEKLARHGKAGVEEIVRTISDVFTVLLIATADGGDVLKFSGDALVLFYDAPDHARRACHAAITLQRVLRVIGGIDSSRGRVRLRMSIGVHSGRFAFFLCGGDHLELFVLGPAATRAVEAESAAAAGETLITASTAAALDLATFGGRRGGDTVVLRSVPSLPPLAPPAIPASAGGRDVRRFIAPPLRDRLARGVLEHEHRRAAVAFAHVGGVDELLTTGGPDAAFERLQQLTVVTMGALERHGVLLTATDVAAGGGTFMLTAGAPDASADDDARLLLVARAMADADCGLPVRVGVNAGAVFAGAVGPPFRRTYSTMGAATNLAARVTAAAGWNRVLATDTVVASVAERFRTAAVPPFRVKGHPHDVKAAHVEAAVDAGAVATDRSVPFVGRDAELEALCAVVPHGDSAGGTVVEIEGDLGAGRSRLVAELRSRVRDIAWFEVSCDPFDRTSPYHLASALLRRVLDLPIDGDPATVGTALSAVVDRATPALAPLLPLIADTVGATVRATPQASEVAPRYRPARTAEAVSELVAARVRDPAVVVIEDAEHADEASAQLLAGVLARLLPTLPWLVVITRTPRATGLHHGLGYPATTQRLAPLDTETATSLAERLAERTPVPAHVLPDLVARAGGNPWFLAALIDAQATMHGVLPRSVEAMVAARIDELDPDDRRALRYISVLGDRFDAALLEATLGSRGVDSRRAGLWHRLSAFVAPTGAGFAFRNTLIREVAYEGLAYRRRRELHGAVADALATTGNADPSQLAVHLACAERWPQAWDAAREAARRARASGASAVAATLDEMALRAARRLDLPGEAVVEVAFEAGSAWERAGDWDRALAAYAAAAEATADPVRRLDVMVRRARAHEGAGRYPQALRLYRRVLTRADTLSDAERRHRCLADAHVGYASVRLEQGRTDGAVTHGCAAVEHATRGGDDGVLALAHHLLARAYAARDDAERAAAHRDQALPIYAALGDLSAQGTVLFDLGADAQRAGRLDEALWLYERSHEVHTRAGDVVRSAAASYAIGEVLVTVGRSDDARRHLTEALRTWRGARSPRGVAQATRALGVVALRSDDVSSALDLLEEAAQLAGDIGADDLLDTVRLPLAESLLHAGRYVEAWETATDVARSCDRATAARAHRFRGTALLRTGGAGRAREEFALALAATDEEDERRRIQSLDEEAHAVVVGQ